MIAVKWLTWCTRLNGKLTFIASCLSLIPGCVQLRQDRLQVSRRVGVVQPQDMLEPAAALPGDGGAPQGQVRRGHRGQVQPAGHQADQGQRQVQQAHQGGPPVPGRESRLLQPQQGHWVAGHTGPQVRPQFAGSGRLQPHVLRAGLQHLQNDNHREMPL